RALGAGVDGGAPGQRGHPVDGGRPVKAQESGVNAYHGGVGRQGREVCGAPGSPQPHAPQDSPLRGIPTGSQESGEGTALASPASLSLRAGEGRAIPHPTPLPAGEGEQAPAPSPAPRGRGWGGGGLFSHPDLAAVLLIVLVALSLRAAFAFRAPAFVTKDSIEYVEPALNLVDGRPFVLAQRRTPAYPLVM